MSERDVAAFEAFVLTQQAVPPERYDEDYFAGGWRGDDRYDLEARRRIEDRNPRLIADVLRPASLLDVGCGPGFLLALLAELGVEGDGIDFSPSAPALAPEPVRARIATGEATALPYADRSYDVVVCRELLEHLTARQLRRAVTELCRVSDRLVYVTTRFHPAPESLLAACAEPDVDPTHLTLLTKPFLRALFVLEGFRSRADLEEQLDWAAKGRVLVLERVEEAA
jgi:SAM-dependent methyltransferase